MKTTLSLTLFGLLLFTSCVVNEPQGALYTDITLPVRASAATGSKTGTSKAVSYLNLYATGDCSIEAAKKDGGISVVASVDRKVESVLGIISTYTTIVTGH